MADPKLEPGRDEHHEDIEVGDPDSPEWTEDDFAKARPFREVFPEMHAKWESERATGIKSPIGYLKTVEIALPQELFEALATREQFWRTRMEEMLEASIRTALAESVACKRA